MKQPPSTPIPALLTIIFASLAVLSLAGCTASLSASKAISQPAEVPTPPAPPPPPVIPSTTDPVSRSGPKYVVGVDFPTVSSCIANALPDSTCVLAAQYHGSESVTVALNQSHLTIECEPGASLIAAASSAALTLNATDIVVDGCDFDGQSQASANNGIHVHLGSDIYLINDTFHGFSGAAILVTDSSNITIAGDSFYNNTATPIYGETNINTISIVNNPRIDTTDISKWGLGIGLHSTNAGDSIQNVDIESNYFVNGNSFCVEIGSFGGNLPNNITLKDNYCSQVNMEGYHGGYSLSGTTNATVVNNVYLLNDAPYGGMSGIEAVAGSNASITGNSLWGLGISIDQQSSSLVSGNSVYNPVRGVAIGLTSSVSSGNIMNNVIKNNEFLFDGSVSGPVAVWMQCNSAGIVCSFNTIQSNQIVQSGAVSGIGIKIEDDYGSMTGNEIVDNTVSGFSTCVDNDVSSAATLSGNVCSN